MKANTLNINQPLLEEKSLIKYYEEAGQDYYHWSKAYNMHFGYYKSGMNPFHLESLLNEMNNKVMNALAIEDKKEFHLLDLGCGVGAAMRHVVSRYKNVIATGITLVPWQIKKGKTLNKDANSDFKINMVQGDYTNTKLPDGHVNGVIAMESACYATGKGKEIFLNEAYRVLKTTGKFVMIDGFKKRSQSKSLLLKWAYKKLTTAWVLDDLGEIKAVNNKMRELGFKNIKIEEISWPVAVSVAHVPFKTLSFLIKELLDNGWKKMNKSRWNNLLAPLLTMIVGLHRNDFGYYLVTGEK